MSRKSVPGMILAVLTAVLSTVLIAGAGSAQAASPKPARSLDLQSYLGKWHQLAAMPQPFNLVCARDTEARYSLNPDGSVRVRNSCTTWIGTDNRITGRATVVDQKTNAQLRVDFRPPSREELRREGANYIVVGLSPTSTRAGMNPTYSWAVVLNKPRDAGFVLSRTPRLSSDAWGDVRAAIAKAGADECRFLTSPTTGGDDQIRRLCEK
ncbi:lipocalin family protein [Gordonia crocea]|uniref:Lipocalin n=1 Tax=Gordonia crocea TaxID=589162 RepID=A0A7M3SUH2_9ACTN|nr:lipocalin family protein [Gordonia crocea]GED96296.1 lipocalin [Gordonia crocea]